MSTRPLLIKYPLDLMGTNPSNLVVDEPHTLGVDKDRCIVTNAGPFFTESVIIKEAHTGRILQPMQNYKILQPYQEASLRSGQDVSAVIYVDDLNVSTDILVTYRAVGGEFSWAVYAIREMIDQLNLDERPVNWGDIIGTPNTFTPTPHLHDLGDTYGWEYIGYQLEGIRDSILTGDAASHDELRQQFIYLNTQMQTYVDAFKDEFNRHENDKANPHQVTKTQVGLGFVENYPPASSTEALAGTVNNRYMTPLRVAELSNRIASELLNVHTSNKSNPHAVTKAQVGLGSVENYGISTDAEATAGTSNLKYMTPLRTKQAIEAIAIAALNGHKNDKANPHGVTKAQVGLGSVENYPPASINEGLAGTATNRYMTPLRTKEAIAEFAGNKLNAHLNDKSNPHQVTKAQVGLGSVENLALATEAEAKAGATSVNTKYMTPLRTYQAIQHLALTPLNTHINNKTNPHGVTKAQVGLGSVENYPIATQVEARAGTVNNRYMTPLRVAEFFANAKINLPVGYVYIQFPGRTSPSDLFGGTWQLIFNTEGIFFRTEGGNANGFGAGIQEDGGRPINGWFRSFDRGYGSISGGNFRDDGNWSASVKSGAGDSWGSLVGINVSNAANEYRPRNRTWRIWVKIS